MKRWLIVVVLLAVSLWTANLTLFNWWAAGGPPMPNPEQYVMRGNVFAVVTLLLFGGGRSAPRPRRTGGWCMRKRLTKLSARLVRQRFER
jgi:hypothetical protein